MSLQLRHATQLRCCQQRATFTNQTTVINQYDSTDSNICVCQDMCIIATNRTNNQRHLEADSTRAHCLLQLDMAKLRIQIETSSGRIKIRNSISRLTTLLGLRLICRKQRFSQHLRLTNRKHKMFIIFDWSNVSSDR